MTTVIILNVNFSFADFNVSGSIYLEVGISAGEERCTDLHIPNDNYVNTRVQEFQLKLLPFELYPQLSFGTNVPAWLFLVESLGKPNIKVCTIMHSFVIQDYIF